MIKKLKKHLAEEIEERLERVGVCSPFTYFPTVDQPPTNEELMDKINEIIEHINKLENKKITDSKGE